MDLVVVMVLILENHVIVRIRDWRGFVIRLAIWENLKIIELCSDRKNRKIGKIEVWREIREIRKNRQNGEIREIREIPKKPGKVLLA